MFCKNCGCNIADNATFCHKCGAPQQDVPVAVEDPGQKLGTAAMILGIITLVTGLLCGCWGGYIPLGCGITGLVLGIVGGNKSKAAGFENKDAKSGIVLSIVGMAVVLFCLLCIVLVCVLYYLLVLAMVLPAAFMY